jgi:hypothetical protein
MLRAKLGLETAKKKFEGGNVMWLHKSTNLNVTLYHFNNYVCSCIVANGGNLL